MDLKGNALFYARVSTEHQEQDSSIDNQIRAGEEFFKHHPEYNLAEPIDTYVERLSGKSDIRPRYEAMLDRIINGEDIKFIVVKDLKRLSRSLGVSESFKKFCRHYGIKLILLSNGGQEYDPNEETNRMIYGIESIINEEFVHNQSKLARMSHKQKMEAKRLNRNNVTFGYKWDYDINDMVIDEEQAEIVRYIFDLYVFNNLGMRDIMRKLVDKYGLSVSATCLSRWLSETAYIGAFAMNKKGSVLGVGEGEKTRYYMRDKSEWVIVERPDLQIVNMEIFEFAQKIKSERKELGGQNNKGHMQGRFRGTHLFSRKIFCAECGRSYIHYYSNRKKSIGVYKDSKFVKKIDIETPCQNALFSRVLETEIKDISLVAINGFIEKNKDVIPVLLKALRIVIQKSPQEENEIRQLEKRLREVSLKRDRCRDKYINEDNKELQADLHRRYEQLFQEASDIEEKLKVLYDRPRERKVETIDRRMQEIEDALNELTQLDDLDREIVDIFIKEIKINKDGKVDVILNSGRIQAFAITPIDKKKGLTDKKSASSFKFKDMEYYCDTDSMIGVLDTDIIIDDCKDVDNLPLFYYYMPLTKYYSDNKKSEANESVVMVWIEI